MFLARLWPRVRQITENGHKSDMQLAQSLIGKCLCGLPGYAKFQVSKSNFSVFQEIMRNRPKKVEHVQQFVAPINLTKRMCRIMLSSDILKLFIDSINQKPIQSKVFRLAQKKNLYLTQLTLDLSNMLTLNFKWVQFFPQIIHTNQRYDIY